MCTEIVLSNARFEEWRAAVVVEGALSEKLSLLASGAVVHCDKTDRLHT